MAQLLANPVMEPFYNTTGPPVDFLVPSAPIMEETFNYTGNAGKVVQFIQNKTVLPTDRNNMLLSGLHNSNSKLFMFKGKNMGGNMKSL